MGSTDELKKFYFDIMRKKSFVYPPKSALVYLARGGLDSYFEMEIKSRKHIILTGKRLPVLLGLRFESDWNTTTEMALDELCAQIDSSLIKDRTLQLAT